jgi:lipopolysaccharide/colanic/teichoic acid biosynthesis glycosyltransferase
VAQRGAGPRFAGPGITGKRVVEFLVSLVAVTLSLPLLLALAAISALTFRAWPFFRQERVGLGGRRFSIVKIRSLPVDTAATAAKHELVDCRNTGFGRFIRRTHLDELPQLWLVLTGRMALVGPRPEMPALAAGFPPAFARVRATRRPGCTGLWQLSPAASGLIGDAPEYDLFYVQHANARLDCWILWRTVVQFGRPSAGVTLGDVPLGVVARRPEPSGFADVRPALDLTERVAISGNGDAVITLDRAALTAET